MQLKNGILVDWQDPYMPRQKRWCKHGTQTSFQAAAFSSLCYRPQQRAKPKPSTLLMGFRAGRWMAVCNGDLD
jgi:hypothetical protein